MLINYINERYIRNIDLYLLYIILAKLTSHTFHTLSDPATTLAVINRWQLLPIFK